MAQRRIESRANPVIKRVRSLIERRHARWTERAFVVEGPRFVSDYIAAGHDPELVLISETVGIPPSVTGTAVIVVSESVLSEVVDTQHSQGVVAIFPFPVIALPSSSAPLYLVLDGLQDPGNVGTLLRSAAAAGVDAAWLLPGTVDPFNPKAVRAAASAQAVLPIRVVNWDDVPVDGTSLVIAEGSDEAMEYDRVAWSEPTTLVIGAETRGVRDAVRRQADVIARIPMAAGIESLNAGVAGSILLFEAQRQRRHR